MDVKFMIRVKCKKVVLFLGRCTFIKKVKTLFLKSNQIMYALYVPTINRNASFTCSNGAHFDHI